MDFKQLEYIVQIEKDKSITKAAKNLYISQPALNQQLIKLEKELSFKLFDRSANHFKVTEAGKIYLEGASEALLIKKNTYSKLNDLKHFKKQKLILGLTPNRGIKMFTSIYPYLAQEFFNIDFTPIEMSVREQINALKRGDIDLAFLILDKSDRTDDNYIDLVSDELIVAVPSIHPLCRNKSKDKNNLFLVDIKELQYEPFALMYEKSTVRSSSDRIFKKAEFEPIILIETSSTASIPDLVGSNLCCGIIPAYYADFNNPKITYFSLADKPSLELCISYKKNFYLSLAAKEFVKLAKEYWIENI